MLNIVCVVWPQDLVKSHLMFAVHEEVEVLKEQINGLTLKNAQLEYENNVLRSAATAETLAKLAIAPPHLGGGGLPPPHLTDGSGGGGFT